MAQGRLGGPEKLIVITNAVTKDWGVFEYWSIGTVSEEVIKFGNEQKWAWPKDPTSFLGQKYRVAQCFVYQSGRKDRLHEAVSSCKDPGAQGRSRYAATEPATTCGRAFSRRARSGLPLINFAVIRLDSSAPAAVSNTLTEAQLSSPLSMP
jgi:hypothetical protein